MNRADRPSAMIRPLRLRGVATLAILILLLMASLLAAAWAQRNSLNEIRSAANQANGGSAFEAAEAGLAWAQAMLNGNAAIGSDCRPSSSPGESSSFRGRYLQPIDAAGRFFPRNGAAAEPLNAICVRGATGWNCSCPSGALPSLTSPGAMATPMFKLALMPSPAAGSVEVIAIGCSQVGRPCADNAEQRADANTRLRLTLAFQPTLATAPVATLTTRAGIDAVSASLGLHNADALSGGLAAQAGADISGSALRVGTTPGAAAAAALLRNDESLAGLSPEQFFSRFFATDSSQWSHLPGVGRLQCTGDCSAALLALVESSAEIARIAIDGDLRLAGNLQIGSRNKPVVLVVDGDLILSGPVRINGLVHARRMRWDATAVGSGALLHGAVLLSEGYSGDGSPDLVYDSALMLRLKRQSGTWLRVPGSWRDF